jgi:hypothetical protein
VQSVIDCVVQGIDDACQYSAATKIASVWRGKRARMQAGHVEDTSSPANIEKFFQLIETTAGCPCYRRIQVTLNAQGKKEPRGEKNDMSPSQIGADRGCGNTFSLSVKHVARLYVVDFDTKDLDGCKLRDHLDSLGAACVETKKGYHY